MNPEITKIIEQYLAGELSAADKAVFEDRMNKNEELRNEVEFQKSIHKAAKRANLRSEVSSIGKSYHFLKNLKWGGLGLGVILAATIGTVAITKALNSKSDLPLSQLNELTSKLEKSAPIDNLKSEFFTWNSSDTAFLSKDGVLISVPKNALLLNGKPYSDPAIVQFQEALDGASIVKSGLSTTSNGELLETQGMFSFSATTKDGKQLTINPKVGVYVQVPVDEYKEGMQLFDGEKDASGNINWVKPRALEKIPVPVDMANLDFYPSGYENKLDVLKSRKAKEYRDSLYLSFEGEQKNDATDITKYGQINSIQSTRTSNQSVEGFIDNYVRMTFSIEYLQGDFAYLVGEAKLKNGWYIAEANTSNLKDLQHLTNISLESENGIELIGNLQQSREPQKLNIPDNPKYGFNNQVIFKQKVRLNKSKEIICAVRYSSTIFSKDYSINVDGSTSVTFNSKQNIPPSSVLGFWNKKFNNTLLATREFETRMKEVHKTCDKSVLDVYLKNLNKPMHELDQQIVGKGYANFQKFVDENVGALNPNNPHLKGLQDFYEKAIQQLQAKEKNLREKEQQKRADWDQKVNNERTKESSRTSQREAQVFCEEYTMNHKNVRKQLGYTLGAVIYGTRPISNIDRFVYETTLARKTAEFTDPKTGKTARIQYNDFTFSVENSKQYAKLFAYIFPDKLNSYHRIDHKDGKFSFPLNDEIIYDLAIVGISEKGYHYVQRITLKGGDLGTLNLDKISETKLDASVRQLNEKRGVKPFDVKQEIEWLKTEQQDYVEQKRRKDEQKFRDEIWPIVYPCACKGDSLQVVGGSQSIAPDNVSKK